MRPSTPPDEPLAPPPATWGRGRPWRARRDEAHRGARGRAYGDVSPALAELVAAWLGGATDALEPIRPPAVFRCGALVVKRFLRVSAFDRVRAPRAVRVAELHFRCLPIPSPRPLLAASPAGPRWRARPGLLLREYVEGRLLSDVWGRDARAADELAPFLARMRAEDVLHGDLHPGNLIWADGRWMLLDVEGVRHGLHSRTRVEEGQWARLVAHLDDEPGLRRAFAAYRRLCAEPEARDEAAWARIRAQAEHLARQFR